MPSVNLRIPTDDVVRRDSERILAEPGLTMTSAVNIFQRAVVRENGMPFGLNSDVPNAETAAAIREGRRLADDPMVRGYSDIGELRKASGHEELRQMLIRPGRRPDAQTVFRLRFQTGPQRLSESSSASCLPFFHSETARRMRSSLSGL